MVGEIKTQTVNVLSTLTQGAEQKQQFLATWFQLFDVSQTDTTLLTIHFDASTELRDPISSSNC